MKLNKCENNYRCDEDDVTMDELIKAYVKDKFILTGGMSVTDQKATWYRFKRHILPFFKGLKVVQISDSNIIGYVAWRLKMWADREETRKVKKTTVIRELFYIKAIINWGVRKGFINQNPIAKLIMPKIDEYVATPATKEEIIRILKFAPPHLKRAILLLVMTGVRPGIQELLRINWESQDLDQKALVIISGRHKIKLPCRMVSISNEMTKLLKKWKQEDFELLKRIEAKKERMADCKTSSKNQMTNQLPAMKDVTGPIVNYHGRQIKSLSSTWSHTIKKAKIERKLRFYDLRHYYVKTVAENVKSNNETIFNSIG